MAAHQGEDCPSCDFVRQAIRKWEYKSFDGWLDEAPPPDSAEYAAMQEKHIAKVVAEELKPIVIPSRHAQRTVTETNKDWVTAFTKVKAQLAENEDAMIALLGKRGTGKTQMAVELIRFMARHRVELGVKPARSMERWALNYYQTAVKSGFAHYSNTMDFFLRLRKTYQQDRDEHEGDVLDAFISPSLLILDEVHDRKESDWGNKTFTYLVDRRYQSACKQTIFIANQTAKQFEAAVGSGIADRIQECGGIVECNWQSFRSGG